MATNVWKGHVGFGLLSIPIKFNVGARDKKLISFSNLHSACHNQLKMPKFCPHCEVQVPADEIVRGYEGPKGWVIVSDEEIEAIEPESGKFIELVETVKWDDKLIDYLAEYFFVLPEPAGLKAYSLLVRALTDTRSAALGRISKSNREHVVLFRPRGNGLMAHFLWYPNELSVIPEFENLKPATLTASEISMAKQLVASLESDFNIESYENGFEQRMISLVTSKFDDAVKAPTPVKARPTKNPDDVMELLSRSLASGKPKRAITIEAKPAAKSKKGRAA